MRYNRIVVKLSGGAVSGDKDWGFDSDALNHIADEVIDVYGLGIHR